jgi:hypothetical protein
MCKFDRKHQKRVKKMSKEYFYLKQFSCEMNEMNKVLICSPLLRVFKKSAGKLIEITNSPSD